METGNCVRTYQYNNTVFYYVHANGRFLILTSRNVFIILDTQELINKDIQDKDLWMMDQEMPLFCTAVSNKTKIFATNERELTVFDCWLDRVHEVIDDDDDDDNYDDDYDGDDDEEDDS